MLSLRNISYLLSFLIFVLISCQTQVIDNADDNSSIEEFRSFKFGMFIHWGLYAIPGGIWHDKVIPAMSEHIMLSARIPISDYTKLTASFNPVDYDPEEWVRLAKDAGMKYLVITAKHHEGFAMFDSKVTEFDIVDATPFKKDPLKALSRACEKNDMKFGFYHSHSRDWHEPNAAGNTWDFKTPEKSRDLQGYMNKKALPQIEELLKNYGQIFLMWYDTPDLLTKKESKEFYDIVKRLQPQCLVNNRIGHNLGDYDRMRDNQVPVEVRGSGNYWEVPATLNNTWGFKYRDSNWKKPENLIFKLIDIISKGGNYLLNVGPDANGQIPIASQKILRKVGEWINPNSEAIYGTGHSPFYLNSINWRCTTKPNKLYFHVFKWSHTIQIKGLQSKVISARFLSNNQKVKYTQSNNKLTFYLLKLQVNSFNTIIKVEIIDSKPIIHYGFGWNDPQDMIEIHSKIAQFRGDDIIYDRKSESAIGFLNSGDELWWNLKTMDESTYDIDIEYSCKRKDAKKHVNLKAFIDEQVMPDGVKPEITKVNYNDKIEPTSNNKEFHRIRLGQVHMMPEMNYRIVFNTDASTLKLKRIILSKSKLKEQL